MSSSRFSSHDQENEATARRAFMKQVGKAVATAPAVALLVAASETPAAAQYNPNRHYPNRNHNGPLEPGE